MDSNGFFSTEIQPRFCETDALGHIGNTVVPQWFELSRKPIFKAVLRSTEIKHWPLIIARTEIDYLQQMYFDQNVTVKAKVEKIGNKSFTLTHQAYQNNKLCAQGKAVMVYFDFKTNSTCLIPDDVREKLTRLLTP